MPRTELAQAEPKQPPAAPDLGLDTDWLAAAKDLPLVWNQSAQGKASPARIAKLCELIADATPMVIACEAVGLSPATIVNWRKGCTEFEQLLAQAEAWGVCDRVAKVSRNPDPKWAAWMLARHHKTRDHFKPPDYGAQRHARVEIAFNFGRDQLGAVQETGHVLEHNAQLSEPSA